MNLKLFLSSILMFGYVSLAIAQDAILRGKITDETTREALIGVNIVSGSTGSATDLDGKYEIRLEAGQHRVEFRYLGYRTISRNINLSEGEERTLDIAMRDESRDLEIVVVSASRFEKVLGEETVSVEVLSNTLIENSNSVDMQEAIEKVPGVTVVDGQANIRGGSGWSYGAGSRVLLLVDDLPMLTADAADVKWSIIPIENVEQVEVIKGAASAIYGSSALNGIINVRTAWPRSEPSTRISLYNGVYDNPRDENMIWWGKNRPVFSGGFFAHRQRFGNFDLVLGSNFTVNKSYLDGGSEQNARVNFKTRYRPAGVDGLSFGLNGNFYQSSGSTYFLWGGPDSLALRPFPGTVSNYNSQRIFIDPHVSYIDGRNNQYNLRLRYFNATNRNDTEQGSVPNLYYGEFQYQRRFEEIGLNFVTGLSGYYSTVTSPTGDPTESLIGEHEGYNVSIYAQADKKFFDLLTFSFGARYEYFKIDTFESDARPNIRVGANYQFAEASYLRASYGEGYRFPTMAEKFVRTNVGPIGIYPNLNLEPETGWSAEIGFKQGFRISNWLGYLDIAGFINEYDNMMEFTFGQHGTFADPLFGIGFASYNIGNTRIIGGEITGIGQGSIGEFPITLLAGYTYIDPKFRDFDDSITLSNNQSVAIRNTTSSSENVLKYRNRHSFKADVESEYRGFSLGFSVNYTSFMEAIDKQFLDFGRQEPFVTILGEGSEAFKYMGDFRDENDSGHWVFDVRVGYNLSEQAKISFIVKNLTNTLSMSRPGIIDPPRNYAMRLTYEF
ncbi:MAG: TonB-dependent receptor [Chitinophagaceae bacterium]|nr:MAG: TonB-dependent receptor [Chitinophagaceae bacterium]